MNNLYAYIKLTLLLTHTYIQGVPEGKDLLREGVS